MQQVCERNWCELNQQVFRSQRFEFLRIIEVVDILFSYFGQYIRLFVLRESVQNLKCFIFEKWLRLLSKVTFQI